MSAIRCGWVEGYTYLHTSVFMTITDILRAPLEAYMLVRIRVRMCVCVMIRYMFYVLG